MRRSPTADDALLAAAFQAAVNKARELGWNCVVMPPVAAASGTQNAPFELIG